MAFLIVGHISVLHVGHIVAFHIAVVLIPGRHATRLDLAQIELFAAL